MIDVDALCCLISRLTPAQRSVLADLAAHPSGWWDVGDEHQDGIAEGLCRLGLIERHPGIWLLYRVTLLGLVVGEVLIDTEVIG